MTHVPVTLVIETAFGVLERTIPGASPLPPEARGGEVAENAVRDAAAKWGLPDFVFGAKVFQKGGRGRRQIGDNLLIVGDLGMVVQVKRRENATTDEARERNWLSKNADTALGQAHGTIRTLKSTQLRLTNHRDRSLDVDSSKIRWIAIAVLEHPNAPLGVTPDTESGPNPAVALIRRDWEFLFSQLKSTHAVGQYFERVVGESWELGAEAARYFQLADADAHATPGPAANDVFRGMGHVIPGVPMLPLDPVGTGDDELPHVFLRSLYEDIATGGADISEERRLRVLAELDRLSVNSRALMGTYLLDSMESAATASPPSGQVAWRLRQFTNGDPLEEGRALHLAFATCSRAWDDLIRAAFTVWVMLRHHQMAEAIGTHDFVTAGIAVTPRTDGIRPWDTSLIAAFGDLALTPVEIREYEEAWPIREDVVELE